MNVTELVVNDMNSIMFCSYKDGNDDNITPTVDVVTPL